MVHDDGKCHADRPSGCRGHLQNSANGSIGGSTLGVDFSYSELTGIITNAAFTLDASNKWVVSGNSALTSLKIPGSATVADLSKCIVDFRADTVTCSYRKHNVTIDILPEAGGSKL
jgi:hypothetical protein